MSQGKKPANEFLAAMTPEAFDEPAETRNRPIEKRPKTTAQPAKKKHVGGYFEPDTVEKVAILRARLGLDNSELLKLAIEDLFTKHQAQRKFGDA